MSHYDHPHYRFCVRCRKRWNVSAIEPGPEVYICPVCTDFCERKLKG